MRAQALLVTLVLGLLCTPVTAVRADTCPADALATADGGCVPVWYGQTPGGAYYTIAIPAGWTADRGLVIWNHGFESYLTGVSGTELNAALALNTLLSDWEQRLSGTVQARPGLGPWRDTVLSQGYAMAASSYTQTGWAVFDSQLANAELYAAFASLAKDTLGQSLPATGISPFYLIGASLGGIVTLRDLEAPSAPPGPRLLPEADGALLACGAVAGPDNWRHAFDTRMLFDAVCAGTGTALPTPWYEIPGAGAELRLLQSLESCTAMGSRLVTERLVAELQTQIAALGSIDSVAEQLLRAVLQSQQADLYNDWTQDHAQESARLARLLELTSIPTGEFLALDLWYAVFELPRLINEPTKLAGRIPFHNIAVDYGDADLNRRITRSVALPSSRQALQRNYTPNGNVGKAKILAIHTAQDGLVRVENTLSLAGLVAPAQLATAIVAEANASHCGFTVAEGTSAWNELRAWVEGGVPQPTAQSVQAACIAAASAEECRFDPDFATAGAPLLKYPRPVHPATAGANRFDAATGALTLELLRDPGTGDYYTATLLPVTGSQTRFRVQTVTGLPTPVSGWQPTAALDFAVDPALGAPQPGGLKLYVPNLQILNSAEYTDRYDLYWRRVGETELELMESEVIQ